MALPITRCTDTQSGGKQAAEVINRDTPGAGVRAAIAEIKQGYAEVRTISV